MPEALVRFSGQSEDAERFETLESVYNDFESLLSSRERSRFRKLRFGREKSRKIIKRSMVWTLIQVTFADGTRAIVKQIKPAEKVREFYPQSIQNELAAYMISELLGFRFVPTTVLRSLNVKSSMVQRYISRLDAVAPVFGPKSPLISQKKVDGVKFFDYLIANTDRHGSNYLRGGTKLYAIDHGNAFGYGNETSRKYFFGELQTVQLEQKVAERLRAFQTNLHAQDVLRRAFRLLLSEKHANTYFNRIMGALPHISADGTVDLTQL